MDLVCDLTASRGSVLVDARDGRRYLDLYSFFASAPLGINPPELVDDPEFLARLGRVAVNKPANPDVGTVAYAEFVATFARVLGDPRLPKLLAAVGGIPSRSSPRSPSSSSSRSTRGSTTCHRRSKGKGERNS